MSTHFIFVVFIIALLQQAINIDGAPSLAVLQSKALFSVQGVRGHRGGINICANVSKCDAADAHCQRMKESCYRLYAFCDDIYRKCVSGPSPSRCVVDMQSCQGTL
ncbi:hypothetical protein AB6A40_010645 [Gnathostoma spinigerum]|uniref:Uncharacterized protein n=1 Tax=Gnathostoma spinigerum TaxID=75299 RepID=A0ABD6F1J2_9BILA